MMPKKVEGCPIFGAWLGGGRSLAFLGLRSMICLSSPSGFEMQNKLHLSASLISLGVAKKRRPTLSHRCPKALSSSRTCRDTASGGMQGTRLISSLNPLLTFGGYDKLGPFQGLDKEEGQTHVKHQEMLPWRPP